MKAIADMTEAEFIAFCNSKTTTANDRKKACASEHDLQVQCVRSFRSAHPNVADLLFAIPNGGMRNRNVAKKLKAEGVQKGVPDLFLAIPRGVYHGLFIEMKNGRAGRVRESQESMLFQLSGQSYKCAVARTADEFDEIIANYLQENL